VKLVDTSVWIDFFRGAPQSHGMQELLEAGEVMTHPWIIGELALGSLGRRGARVLADLRFLPQAPVVHDDEVMLLIEAHQLAGEGIGWVDAQLLASSRREGVELWSHDSRLARLGRRLQT
jgi:predicted nucleic acid-binding protein